MYDIKALYEAGSVDDACRLLKEHPGSQVIAGGSDVLVQVREGKRAGKELVSIYMLDELRGICLDEDENIRIGSLTSFSHITKNPIIQKYINVLGEAVDQIGGPQIRNIGTIGGNTCNGVTSADSASTLFAWDVQVEIAGEGYRRVVPINEFYIKAGTVALKEGEIQTAIIIPKKAYEGYKGHYIKYAMREAMDIATTGCSVNVKLSADKKIFEDVRIAYGVAGPIPMRVFSAENFLRGKEVNDANMEAFSQKVLDDINPRDSWRASKAFRCHIGVVMAKRACEKAVKLAGGVVDDRTEI
nr:xanthine dehydrogenase subunit XdhB [uncultured Lachnoanaerobaculum sp.]